MTTFKQFILYVSVFFMLFATCDRICAEIDPELADAMQKKLDEYANQYNTSGGATLAVTIPDQGTWLWAYGMADRQNNIAMKPENMFRIASITKTFVSATILKLAEENIITLEDSIERWLPGIVPNGENITITNLLRHTSGLYDVTNSWNDIVKDLNKIWQPEEIIAIATAQPPVFAPGTRYSYCNTGYILLGMIIEAATHTPVEQVIRNRFLTPLQLNNTFFDVRENIPEGLAKSPSAPFPYTAISSAFLACGGMLSDAEDLVKWAESLYSGDVLKPESLDKMLTFTAPSLGYGLGVMKGYTVMGESFGHDGGLIGYASKMYYIPNTGITVVALSYDNTGVFATVLKVILNPKSVDLSGKLATTWGSIRNN